MLSILPLCVSITQVWLVIFFYFKEEKKVQNRELDNVI